MRIANNASGPVRSICYELLFLSGLRIADSRSCRVLIIVPVGITHCNPVRHHAWDAEEQKNRIAEQKVGAEDLLVLYLFRLLRADQLAVSTEYFVRGARSVRPPPASKTLGRHPKRVTPI